MIQHVSLGGQAEIISTIPAVHLRRLPLAESGTADRLVRFANALLDWMPGGRHRLRDEILWRSRWVLRPTPSLQPVGDLERLPGSSRQC